MDNEYSLDRDNIVLICLMFHFLSDHLIQTEYIITNTVVVSAVHKTYLALGLTFLSVIMPDVHCCIGA